MNTTPLPKSPLITEVLLLPDGRILVHNLTPLFAALLSDLNPADEQIQPRAARIAGGQNEARKTDTTK
ncbi:MAG: hypothetical protein DME18_02210 [Verrucomicrobia bacterium]|nr:MAG: hypothetical protein DME19_06900 [Verrucomicrobiota bacterium]PYM16161.1 MAG: hypothetical protein DME18_02210 [Verrucomicrobiota bacterium]